MTISGMQEPAEGSSDTFGQGMDHDALQQICAALREVRYGSIVIHLQDGAIMQVDKLQKIRIR